MWVNGINVLQELLAMFHLSDEKGVIHIPKPKPWWIVGSADGFGFKLLHEQVGYNGTDGGNPWLHNDMFIIFTLGEEIGNFSGRI